MATLEKIRSKSVLLFAIIIAALLAFIFGDFFNSHQAYFGTGTAIAEAKGQKVDQSLYSQRMNIADEQARSYNQNVDGDELSQNVIKTLVAEALLNQEFENLGIHVSDNEITQAMTGVMPHPAAQQFIYQMSQQLGLEQMDGKTVLDAIKNPAKYNIPVEYANQFGAAWAQTEQAVEEAMLQQKFYSLVQGLFTANELDARSIYNDNSATRHIAYVTKGYNTVPDEDAQITDADIKAAWDADKNAYRIDEETRAVDYVYVVIEPSAADRMAGQKVVEDALLALNESDGLSAVNEDSRFVINHQSTTASRINDKATRDFITAAEDGKAEIVNNSRDNYTIAKRLSASEQIDSINVSVIALRNAADADSIMNALKSGAKWADFVATDNTQGQDSIWVSLVSAGSNIDNKLRDAWLSAAVGTPTLHTDSIQGQNYAQIFKVNRRNAPVTVYDFATVAYTVDPSNETLEKLNTDLRTFLSSNSTGDDFSANAAEAGYSILPALVSASAPHIANIPDSRSAVKWVMNAKKGQVSPVIGDNKQTYLMAIAVKDIYNDFIPWNAYNVRPELQSKAIAEKKGQKLIADFAGKANDLAGYASLFGGEVTEGDAIFVSPRLANIGFQESALQGAVASAPEGKVVGPVAGKTAVVVFEVKSVSDENRPYTFDEYAQRFNRTMGVGTIDSFKLLLGKDKVNNYSLNFIQGIEN